MAGGKARGVNGGSSKKKKKGKPLSKDPARLAAVHATLSRWASVSGLSSDPSLLRMDLHTHSTCSKCPSPPTRLICSSVSIKRSCDEPYRQRIVSYDFGHFISHHSTSHSVLNCEDSLPCVCALGFTKWSSVPT